MWKLKACFAHFNVLWDCLTLKQLKYAKNCQTQRALWRFLIEFSVYALQACIWMNSSSTNVLLKLNFGFCSTLCYSRYLPMETSWCVKVYWCVSGDGDVPANCSINGTASNLLFSEVWWKVSSCPVHVTVRQLGSQEAPHSVSANNWSQDWGVADRCR